MVWPCQSQVEEPSRNPNTLPSISVFPIQLTPTVLPIFSTQKKKKKSTPRQEFKLSCVTFPFQESKDVISSENDPAADLKRVLKVTE